MIRWLVAVLLLAGCSTPARTEVGPLLLALSADSPAPARHSVVLGQSVELTVTSSAAVEVHVHGFDVIGHPGPSGAAVLKFVADRSGTFEIELHPGHTLLGQLVVR